MSLKFIDFLMKCLKKIIIKSKCTLKSINFIIKTEIENLKQTATTTTMRENSDYKEHCWCFFSSFARCFSLSSFTRTSCAIFPPFAAVNMMRRKNVVTLFKCRLSVPLSPSFRYLTTLYTLKQDVLVHGIVKNIDLKFYPPHHHHDDTF